jgi:hypothetical protein
MATNPGYRFFPGCCRAGNDQLVSSAMLEQANQFKSHGLISPESG